MTLKMLSRYATASVAAVGLCMAAGCATTDTVSSRFPQLEESINAAKAVEAQVYAPAPLTLAEDKLAAARAAVAAKDMALADKLVDEAMADADLAQALAPAEKAKQEAVELRKAILGVREEIGKLPAAQ